MRDGEDGLNNWRKYLSLPRELKQQVSRKFALKFRDLVHDTYERFVCFSEMTINRLFLHTLEVGRSVERKVIVIYLRKTVGQDKKQNRCYSKRPHRGRTSTLSCT